MITSVSNTLGVRQGSAGKVSLDGHNVAPKVSQQDLAINMGLDQKQLQRYKQLNDLIPELQQMIENGSMKATVGYKRFDLSERRQNCRAG